MDPATEFAGRIALVTAAAGMGVGQAVARRLAAAGAHVIVTDVHATRTWECTQRLMQDFPGAGATGLVLDAGDPVQIDAVLDEIRGHVGAVDILVNNAAVNWAGPVWEYPLDKWRRTLDVNLTGAWYLARQVMGDLRRAGRRGAIINIMTMNLINVAFVGNQATYGAGIYNGKIACFQRKFSAGLKNKNSLSFDNKIHMFIGVIVVGCVSARFICINPV